MTTHAILGSVARLIPDADPMDLICGRASMEVGESKTGGILEFWIHPYAARYEDLKCPDCRAIVDELRAAAHVRGF